MQEDDVSSLERSIVDVGVPAVGLDQRAVHVVKDVGPNCADAVHLGEGLEGSIGVGVGGSGCRVGVSANTGRAVDDVSARAELGQSLP